MGSEEKFCLRWNDFESSLSWSFQQFRSQLQDVHIVCGSRMVAAHRLVLCACSAILRDMILRSNSASSNPVLLLLDTDPRELDCLLDFMYCGEVSVQQDRLQLFLQLAEKLQVAGLTQNDDDPQDKAGKPTDKSDKCPPGNIVGGKNCSTNSVKHPPKKFIKKPQPGNPENSFEVQSIAEDHHQEAELVDNNDHIVIETVKSEVVEASAYQEYYDTYSEDHGAESGYGASFGGGEARTSSGDEFPCHICGKTYKTAGSLKNHRSLYHRDQTSKYQSHIKSTYMANTSESPRVMSAKHWPM